MNMEEHAEQVRKINKLVERLRKEPDNKTLKSLIHEEEQKLYHDELKTDWEMEKFFRENGININEDDED